MSTKLNPLNNPRVIIIQKIYSQFFNKDANLVFEKHRFKKFIKFVVNGTLERNELIDTEIIKYLKEDVNIKKIFVGLFFLPLNFFLRNTHLKV